MVVYDAPGPFWPNFQDIGNPRGLSPSLPHSDPEVGFCFEQVVEQSPFGLYAIPGYKRSVGGLSY